MPGGSPWRAGYRGHRPAGCDLARPAAAPGRGRRLARAAYVRRVRRATPAAGTAWSGALLDAHPDVADRARGRRAQVRAAGFGRRPAPRPCSFGTERERVDVGVGVRQRLQLRRRPASGRAGYRRLTVVGDKKGGRTTAAPRRAPGARWTGWRATVGLPVRLVQVVRNPYDNIATMARRAPRLPPSTTPRRTSASPRPSTPSCPESPPEGVPHGCTSRTSSPTRPRPWPACASSSALPVQPDYLGGLRRRRVPPPRSRHAVRWSAGALATVAASAVIERAARPLRLDVPDRRRRRGRREDEAGEPAALGGPGGERVRALPGVPELPGPLRRLDGAVPGATATTWPRCRTFLVFIGHPRSGHSLVGSLLDAHPRRRGGPRARRAPVRRRRLPPRPAADPACSSTPGPTRAAGRTSWGYSYAVPGQWQGRYRDLAVVGDKRGRMTTDSAADPARAARPPGRHRRACRSRSSRWSATRTTTSPPCSSGARCRSRPRSAATPALCRTGRRRRRPARPGRLPPAPPRGPGGRHAGRARRAVRVPRRRRAGRLPRTRATACVPVAEPHPGHGAVEPGGPGGSRRPGGRHAVARAATASTSREDDRRRARPCRTSSWSGRCGSGSTSLYKYLQVHPQVWMPRKEIHFFDRRWDNGARLVPRPVRRGGRASRRWGRRRRPTWPRPRRSTGWRPRSPRPGCWPSCGTPWTGPYSHYWMEHVRGRAPTGRSRTPRATTWSGAATCPSSRPVPASGSGGSGWPSCCSTTCVRRRRRRTPRCAGSWAWTAGSARPAGGAGQPVRGVPVDAGAQRPAPVAEDVPDRSHRRQAQRGGGRLPAPRPRVGGPPPGRPGRRQRGAGRAGWDGTCRPGGPSPRIRRPTRGTSGWSGRARRRGSCRSR